MVREGFRRKMSDMDDSEGPPAKKGNSMAWMVTFTDLVSLMLTFFVLLFSMSSIKVDQWETVIDSLTQTLNPSRLQSVAAATAQYNISTIFRKRAIDLGYLNAIVSEGMKKDPILNRAQVVLRDEQLLMALPGDLLFQPGSANMTERAREALFNLGGVLRNIGNQIAVNGHTDRDQPGEQNYTSNWELSVARAASVANAIRRSGYEDDVIAFGLADSHYGGLPLSLSDEERSKLARRVDIVVLPTVGN